ncbi:hypothetical protein ACM614_05675, partial [Streptomyces sp. 12297]
MLHEISDLIRCSAVFLPADPARTGRIAFWHPDGETAAVAGLAAPDALPGISALPGPSGLPGLSAIAADPAARIEELTVLTPALRTVTVSAVTLPVRAALPFLTRARAAALSGPEPSRTAPAFW